MKVLKNNLYMLGLLWKASPARVILNIMSYVVWRMYDVVYSVILMRFIMKAIEDDWGIDKVLLFLGAMLFYSLAASAYNSWFDNVYVPKTNVVIQKYLLERVYEKAVECDLSCYENPEFYDKYTRANAQILELGPSILDNLSNMAATIVSVIICAVIIMRWEPIVVPIAAVCAAGAIFIDKKRSDIRFKAYNETTKPQRETDYVKRTLYLADYAKEMRLGNIFFPLMSHFEEAVKSILEIDRKRYTVVGILRCIREIFMSLGAFLAVQGIIAYRYIAYHAYRLSDVVTILNAASALQMRIYSLTWNMSDFMTNGLHAENIRRFMEYETKIKEDDKGLDINTRENTLVLKNVSFRYDGQKKNVIHNINIEIPHGAKIAFVGHNGAGKSTLVKLLTRLYDVSEGEILLDGVNIKNYKLSKYRAIFSTVLQDFKIFAASITENVLLRPPENDDDKNEAIRALKSSGLYKKASGFEKGMDTLLTKEFDDNGVLMSGGEFQKLAVSRVFANKKSSIAILDEPSSALDPISEYEIFENMMEACGGKTVIFISHRLSSAVLADRIYMLENGGIIEEGTHGELMELNGKYAEMFRMQSEKYQEYEEAESL